MIRVKGVEQEVCVCGSVCGGNKKKQKCSNSRVEPLGSSRSANPKRHTPTSLWEELSVDVFKGLFIDDSAGTFLEDQIKFHPDVKKTSGRR